MNLNDYQRTIMTRFMNPETSADKEQQLLNGVLGLCGESGEVADMIKKWAHHGHDLDLVKLRKELGDVLYYVASTADSLGTTLEQIAQMNIEKLSERYPNGFSVEDSKTRRDTQPVEEERA